MLRVELETAGPKPSSEVSIMCMKRKSRTATPVIRCKAQASMPGPPRYMLTLVRRVEGSALFHLPATIRHPVPEDGPARVYTHALNRGPGAVRSRADRLLRP